MSMSQQEFAATPAPVAARGTAFGRMLRQWRAKRGASQLELALASDVSQRHVSFLESGRARPSREMVVQLASALAVPLRHQNALLMAAGFAPVYRESDLSAPEMADINRALDFMLEQQEPYPAVVVDRHWNLLRANRANARLFGLLLGPAPAKQAAAQPPNLLHMMLAPHGLRPLIVNWQELAQYLIRQAYAEALALGSAEEAKALLDRLTAYPDIPRHWHLPRIGEWQPPVLTVNIKKGATELKLFSTIATLGTPQDVTLQEIRVENFYPADENTASFLRKLAQKP
jgi:transcriptional regulator with XRE-family HTH domain